MVAASVRSTLTRVGFRRDVRLFLASFVGFLILLLTAVLLLLQRFEQQTEAAIRSSWNHSAGLAARELSALTPAEQTDLQTRVILMIGRYDLDGAIVTRPKGMAISEGIASQQTGIESVVRPLPYGTFTAVFDAGTLHRTHKMFVIIATGTLIAASLATILLLLYIPRITGPVEQMLTSAAELRDREPHDDEQQYLISTFRESITTLKAQEQELLRLHQAERMRADDLERVTGALTRSIGSGFVSVDPSGRLIDVNAVAREILGTVRDDPRGLTIDEAFGVTEFSRTLNEALASRAAINRRELALTVSAQQRVVGLTTVPLLGIERQFLGMLALFTDLTPVRRLENRVREMQNLADLGEISAGIAHEFRNSLSAILGFLRLSKDREPADARRSVENAEREALALAKAVDALLIFAKPMTFETDVVDLLELSSEIVQRVSQQFPDVPIECRGEQALVKGDTNLLGRALENLIRNAADSVKQKGSGSIRVAVSNEPEPEVRIEDDGIGLDQASVPRLFLPFQSDSPGGYGLGLPLVKKIVLLHEGTVELSGEQGKGARATIRFPHAAGAAPAGTKSNTLRAS
jgi:signal transduction histidine kinase